MIESFRTDRLAAHCLGDSDHDDLCRMHRNPDVMATLGGLRTEEETRQFLDRDRAHWERYGFGLWALRDPSDGRFVGRAGLRHVAVGDADEVELAYALRADCWGRGLATEIARALLAIGFEHLGLAEVVAFTLPTNRGSRRVMEKTGFRFEREIMHANLPHVLYRCSVGHLLKMAF